MATTTTVVFDWDCTITSVHMYKAAAGWTPYSGELAAWLRQQGGGAPLPDLETMYSKESLHSDDGGGPVTRALTLGGGAEGRAHLRRVAGEAIVQAVRASDGILGKAEPGQFSWRCVVAVNAQVQYTWWSAALPRACQAWQRLLGRFYLI